MSPVFDSPLTTNDLSLDRLLAVRLPIMLVFIEHNEGQNIQKELNTLAEQFAGKLLIAKISPKENPGASSRFRISQTPTIVGLKDGEIILSAQGLPTASISDYARFFTGLGPKPIEDYRRESASDKHNVPINGKDRTGGPTGSQPKPVTDHSFDKEVMHSTLPVLVDFWAPWCGPCKITDPILEKLAPEMHGKLAIVKVNVDENPQLSYRYGIQSIPTMIVVKNGNVIDRWTGALPEPAIRQRLSTAIRS
jgi:thioredoxin 1